MSLILRDPFGKCIICKNKHNSALCKCDNYIGDATALITALSSNAFTLDDFHTHIRYQKSFSKIFHDDFNVARFHNPYISAVDFIIKVGENYKDFNKVARHKNHQRALNDVHWNTLPVLFEYLRTMINKGSNKRSFMREEGADALIIIVDLVLIKTWKEFETKAAPFHKSNFLVYNASMHLRDKIYKSFNSNSLDEAFKEAFVQVLPKIESNLIQISKHEAEIIADMFSFSRGLFKKGKYPFNAKSKELINCYWTSYTIENKHYKTQFDLNARQQSERYSLTEFI